MITMRQVALLQGTLPDEIFASLEQRDQVTMNWNVWNQERENAFPHLNCFFSGICHSVRKPTQLFT